MTEVEYFEQKYKLVNAMTECMQSNDFAGRARIAIQLEQLNDRYLQELDETTAMVSDLMKDKPDEVKELFEELTIRLYVLGDLIDSTAIEFMNALNEHTEMKELALCDDIANLHEITAKIVKTFDDNSNADTQEDYAQFSEQLMPLLKKRTEEHLAWIQVERERELYLKHLSKDNISQ